MRIEVDFSDRRIDLVERGVDLAVRIGALRDSSLRARRICPIRMMLCASPDYLARNGTPETPQALADHQVLHYDIGGGPIVRLADLRGAELPVPVRPRLVANNGDFLRDMAIAGHGIVLTPTFIVWQSLARRQLVAVLADYWPPPLDAHAVYTQGRYLPRRARALIDFLAERFGENPYWDQPDA
jgi:DNA-binding transcriptional LysR family regulator